MKSKIYTLEELEQIILRYTWSHFEKLDGGNIRPRLRPRRFHERMMPWPKGPRFCLRVGLHLGKPTQAIMCEGQFVRIRRYDHTCDLEALKVLDPTDPDKALYHRKGWKPPAERWTGGGGFTVGGSVTGRAWGGNGGAGAAGNNAIGAGGGGGALNQAALGQQKKP